MATAGCGTPAGDHEGRRDDVSRLLNSKRTMIAITIVVAFVAVVVPMCRMVDCSMGVGGAMPFGPLSHAGFFPACGGSYVSNSIPQAIVPSGADALTIALVCAVLAAVAWFAPRQEVRFVPVRAQAPPPPPDDPLGTRLTL